jgi:hypothetical protein
MVTAKASEWYHDRVPAKWFVASVLAGAAVAVIYTLSPLTVVAAALSPLLIRAAGSGLPAREARWVWTLLTAAIVLRALTILVMLMTADHDSQAAALLTGDEAYSLARTLRARNFLLGIPQLKYDYSIAFEDYGRTSYLSLLTLLQLLFGPSPYGLRLVNMLLFLTAAVLLFRFARATFAPVPALMALAALLFLPTLFFWSVSLLKESLYLTLSAAVLIAAYAVLRAPRVRWRAAAAVAALAALWALSDMRAGAVYLIGGGAALGVFAYAATANLRRLGIAIVATATVLAVISSRPTLRQGVLNAINQAAQIQVGHVFTVGHSYKTLDEGFYVAWTPDTRLTTGEAARFVVRSVRSFLVEPWPWQMATNNELLFLPEHLLWYAAVLLAVVGIVNGARQDRLATCLLACSIIPTMFVVSMTNGNVGTLIRFRGLVWPYVLVLAAVGVYTLVPGIERLLASSKSGQLVQSVGAALSLSARQSRILRSIRGAALAVFTRDLRERLLLIGVALAAFVGSHLILLQTIPPSAAPMMPLFVWLIAALASIGLMTGASAFARAWPGRLRLWSAK